MSVGPLALLKLLSAAAGGLSRSTASPRPGASFESLLAGARSGEVASGLPVRVAEKSGVSLSAEQLQRLARAADQAESQGASRALVLMDGMALKLDVGVREVTGTAEIKGGSVLTGIDAVISVPSMDGANPEPVPLPRADARTMSPSLLELLSRHAG